MINFIEQYEFCEPPNKNGGQPQERYNQAARQTRMKVNSLIIILIVTIFFGCNSGQKKVTEADLEAFLASQYVKDTLLFRMDTTFPFGEYQAETVELLSYPNRVVWDTIPKGRDGDVYINDTIIKNGKLNFDETKIKDRIKLNSQQKKELFNLLYNSVSKLPSVAACYNPRHMLVFYDDKNKAFAFIEFCLECHQTRQSERVYKDLGIFCDQKISDLRQLFESFGIKYGLNPDDQ